MTPPNKGVTVVTPPNDGVTVVTPANDGVTEVTPPNDGVTVVTPLNDLHGIFNYLQGVPACVHTSAPTYSMLFLVRLPSTKSCGRTNYKNQAYSIR